MTILDDTRADWNARPPLRALTRVPWADRVGVSWHWIGPGKGPSGDHQRCLDQVREWQRQHQAKGWKDIGYPALICQHARAIEGRGLDKEGAHSPGVNWVHVGVQFMCGQDGNPPSAAMLARAVKLRADVGALGKNIARDWAHKDDPKASTACPGPFITNWVHTGGPTKKPAPTTPTSPQEDDMQLSDKVNVRTPDGELVQVTFATILARMSWTYDETLRQKAVLDAIASKLLTADEVKAAAKAALDERIAGATTVLEVKP